MSTTKPLDATPRGVREVAGANQGARRATRRAMGARAVLLGLLAGTRSAFAGLPVLWPLIVISVLIAGVLVVVTVIIADGSDPHGRPGGDPGGSSSVSPWRPDPDPSGGGGGGTQPEPPRRGSLEMRVDGPVDFRELRYTLQYRAGSPQMPGELLHLYAVRDADDRVRAVPPEQIRQQPQRYRQLMEPGVRLCQRGLMLNAAAPRCQGVLRISPSYAQLQSVRTHVTAQASTRPPAGPLAEPDEGDAVSAGAALRLLNTFFVVSTAPPDFRIRVSRAEQDVDQPERFQVRPVAVNGPGHPAEGSARRVDVARDGSRVYMLTDRVLSSWVGDEAGFATLYRTAYGETLASATPTAAGVCVAWARDQQSGLRCLRQDRDNWDPEQPFPRHLSIADMDGAGDGLLIAGSEPGQAEQIRGYYVADAAQPWLHFEEAPLGRAGMQRVDGVVALKGWSAGREDYLIRGLFDGQRPGLWQLGMGAGATEQAPPLFLPDPQPPDDPVPGAQPVVRDVDVWPGLAPGIVRLMVLAQYPAVIDYSLLSRRPVAISTKDWHVALGALRLDCVRVLDGPGREKWLALSGRRMQQPRNFIALMRYRNAAAEPELVQVLDFSDPTQAGLPIRFEAQVRGISQTALVLGPDS